MKYFPNPVLHLVLLLGLSSPACAFQSEDLTPEFSFTEGIEGPAVDSSGMLYAVNYKEEGTIGRVSETGDAEV